MTPQLAVVVDAEEEFDWSKPFSRDETGVKNIDELWRAQDIFDRHGIAPTYVIDYPVATTPSSIKIIKQFLDSGRCAIGTQLHPWVNPPFEEEVSMYNSYPGNLPRELEYEKLRALTNKIEENFGRRPVIYRAGRYGFGSNTTDALEKLNYEIDVSVVPYTSFGAEGGPDYSSQHPSPYWFGRHRRILAVPLTCGFSGVLSRQGENFFPFLGSRAGEAMKIRSAAARLKLLDRVRLSPEGMTLSEMKGVTEQLLRDGTKLFQLCFHSSSLKPGATEYVKSTSDREAFLKQLDDYLEWARHIGIEMIQLPAAAEIIRNLDTELADEGPFSAVKTSNPAIIPVGVEPEPLNYWRRRAIGKLSNRHSPGPKPDIFIFSSPRSGSTHLMELIGTDHTIKIYDEPLNPRKPTLWRRLNIRTWEKATRLSNREDVYRQYFTGLQHNHFPELNVPFYDPNRRPRTNRIVFKIIHGGEDMINWFEQELGGQIVILLRHPIPTALSHRKNPRLPYLIDLESLTKHLSVDQINFAREIVSSGSYFQKSILDWCLQNFLLVRDDIPDSWYRLCYEDIIMSPENTIHNLKTRLNLSPSTDMSATLLSPSRSAVQSDSDTLEILNAAENSDRSFLVNKWLDRVDEVAINQTQQILDVFEIDMYSASNPVSPQHKRSRERNMIV